MLRTIFARSDAVATIYFIMQFCAASIRERLLYESSIYQTQDEDEEIHCLQEGRVAADACESIRRDTPTLATAMNTELEESDPLKDEADLEEKELVLEDW